jgi:hypothetical protein
MAGRWYRVEPGNDAIGGDHWAAGAGARESVDGGFGALVRSRRRATTARRHCRQMCPSGNGACANRESLQRQQVRL